MPWQNVGSPFVVISPVSGIILIYNAAPALGTLAISIVASTDLNSPPDVVYTDQYGNNVLGGTTYYGGASDLYAYLNENNGISTYGFASGPQPSTFPTADSGTVSAAIVNGTAGIQITSMINLQNDITGGNAVFSANANGVADTQMGGSGGDTNNYLIGSKEVSNSSVNVTSTTFGPVLTIPGLGTAGGYRLKGFAVFAMNQNAGAGEFTWVNGTGTVNTANGLQFFIGGTTSPPYNGVYGPAAGPSIASTVNQLYFFDWRVTMSTAGSLTVMAKETVAGDSWQIGSIFCTIEPY